MSVVLLSCLNEDVLPISWPLPNGVLVEEMHLDGSHIDALQ